MIPDHFDFIAYRIAFRKARISTKALKPGKGAQQYNTSYMAKESKPKKKK